MKRFILSSLFFIALLSIWHLLVLAKVWSPMLLPDPISVWEYLKGAAEDGTLLQASMVTMRRLLAGYIIGIAAGSPTWRRSWGTLCLPRADYAFLNCVGVHFLFAAS